MPFFKKTTTLIDTQLETLAEKAVAAAEAVVEMLEHPERASEIASHVNDLEHAADRVVRDTVALQTGPASERAELLELVEVMDDVVDVLDNVAQRLWLHNVSEATPEARALAAVLLDSTRAVQRLCGGLRRGGDPHAVLDHCLEISRLESQADELYRQAILSLFSGSHDALHVVRWKDVYESMERGIDKCEEVAGLVEGLLQAIA